MRKLIMVLTLFPLFMGCRHLAVHPMSVRAPDSLVDLGQVRAGTPMRGQFRIKNGGQDSVRIERVTTDCKCTNSVIDKQVIQPDGSALVTLYYDSTRTGIFQSIGLVYLYDRPDPLVLIFRGNVVD